MLKELDGHVEEELVLCDPRLEASVYLEQLINNLLLFSLCVSLQRQKLCRLQMFLNLLLGFLNNK